MNRPNNTQDDRFAQDVDRLLAGETIPEAGDKEYQADVETVRLLSQVRFTPAPRFESRLRNRLQSQLYQKEVKIMSSKRLFSSLVRPLLVASLSAAILFTALMVVSPEARAAAQGWVAHFVEVDSPWALLPAARQPARSANPDLPAPEGTKAQTVNPGQAASAESQSTLPPVPGDQTKGADVSKLPELNVPSTPPLISVEEAQSKLEFKIRVPSKLPSGYKLRGVVSLPDLPAALPGADGKAPADLPKGKMPQVATLLFANSAGDTLALSELLILNTTSDQVPLPAGNGSVKDVTVNGQPAQYIEGMWTPKGWVSSGHHQLHWQNDNILFDLTSPTLGLQDLMMMAESLQ